MNIGLFSLEGLEFIFRWIHFLAGITWIGILYYFNFVQGEWFKEIDAGVKNKAFTGLVPKALWWFRWGAMFTFLSGLIILGLKGHGAGSFEIYNSAWGVKILVGSVLGTFMWYNVWFVIWPNQKKVIANAANVLEGKAADPNIATNVARAGCASRHNVMFSIALLFFMGAATHLPTEVNPEASLSTFWILFFVLTGALEFNALKGKTDTIRITTIKGVIHMGLALALLIYFMIEFLL